MKITMEPTDQFVIVDGIETRRWLGETERGTKCDVFVPRIRVASTEDTSQFDLEMKAMPQPRMPAIDLRFLICALLTTLVTVVRNG
jgi:hypothetical protein